MTSDGDIEIRITTGGVAHITATSWYGLGYGQGYACARDNLATIWDLAVKVRSERAKHHGPGADGNFVASDFGYLVLGMTERAEAMRQAQSPELADLVAGYVTGANAWLAEALATDRVPAWCAGAAWLQPLDELDLYRILVDTALLGSGRNLVALIGRAEAPGPDGPCEPSPLSALGSPNAASNGWAFGSEVTRGGGGLVVANPHFPWYGEGRFWECHLTIPGEIDVYGASLIGIPGVQLGFNESLGWTHTFSRGSRFTLYRLDLLPGDATRYRFGDTSQAMTSADYEVQVRDGGGTATVQRTLWSSHHGPMVNLPLLGWGNDVGFTYRDGNLDNAALLELYIGMDRARDLDEFEEVLARTKAMPWLNTLATDRSGEVLYTDASATPNLSDAAQQRYVKRLENDPIAALLAENRVPLLDGSDPDDAWIDEPGARSPGLIPHDQLPRIRRRDVVVNANDSHWLTHPGQPLEGYSAMCGFERTPRSLRTRQNLIQTHALAGAGDVTAEAALEVILEGATLTSLLLRDDVVTRLQADGTHTEAAEILRSWDGTVGLDARGAVLWREFLAAYPPADLVDQGALFADGFNPDNPVVAPHDLREPTEGEPDSVVAAMTAAMATLASAGVAPDALVRDVQWVQCGDVRVGVPGGGEVEGVANVLGPSGSFSSHSLFPTPQAPEMLPPRATRTGLAAGGYQVSYGTSYLVAVELTADGPRGLGLLAYGQSEDFTSDADGAFRPLCFTDEAIEADPNLSRQVLRPS